MVSLALRAAIVLGLGGIAAIGAWSHATRWAPAAARYPLQGIDLPERPPLGIEWGTVRADGADFAYLVATSGTDRRGVDFETHWAALPDAGMRRGAVHLYSLCQPAAAQANAFNTVVPRTADALPPAVDLSYRDDCAARPATDTLVTDLRRFVTLVEARSGKPILLRIAPAIERDHALSTLIDRPIWALGNFRAPGYTPRPWALWRASDVRRVDGVEGPVNWDVVAP